MSSYVDVNQGSRRSRYFAPPARRKPAHVQAARVVVVVVVMLIALARVAYGGPRTGTESIVVQPGQSLWSIAAQRYPEDDVRSRVGEIVNLNHLGSAPIYAGEHLSVPAL